MTPDTYSIVGGNPTIAKDPNAVLDYSMDWSAWLAVAGDAIQSASWTVTGGVSVNSSSYTATSTAAFISGGTAGTTATATCRITTVGGRTEDRTIYLTVQDR